MKKLIVIAAGSIVVFAVLRRFGPELRERAMAKCREMFEEASFEQTRPLDDQVQPEVSVP